MVGPVWAGGASGWASAGLVPWWAFRDRGPVSIGVVAGFGLRDRVCGLSRAGGPVSLGPGGVHAGCGAARWLGGAWLVRVHVSGLSRAGGPMPGWGRVWRGGWVGGVWLGWPSWAGCGQVAESTYVVGAGACRRAEPGRQADARRGRRCGLAGRWCERVEWPGAGWSTCGGGGAVSGVGRRPSGRAHAGRWAGGGIGRWHAGRVVRAVGRCRGGGLAGIFGTSGLSQWGGGRVRPCEARGRLWCREG